MCSFCTYRRNILPNINSSYLTQCVFSRKTDPDCPIFRLKGIVGEADEDFQTMAVHVRHLIYIYLPLLFQTHVIKCFNVMLGVFLLCTFFLPSAQGGVMGVQIRWDCDLDLPQSWCVPRYTFRRLDNKDPENNVAPGYNFR